MLQKLWKKLTKNENLKYFLIVAFYPLIQSVSIGAISVEALVSDEEWGTTPPFRKLIPRRRFTDSIHCIFWACFHGSPLIIQLLS